MKAFTSTALALSMSLFGSAALLGCEEETVNSTERTETNRDGSVEKEKEETTVNPETGETRTTETETRTEPANP